MSEEARRARKTLQGWVVSDKMDKTRVIEVRWSKRDPEYEKVRNKTTKLYAHDEKNESHTGDRIEMTETRPLSRMKRWRLVDVLERAR